MTAISTTIPKYNPLLGDYDVTVLRILNGSLIASIDLGSAYKARLFDSTVEDLKDWGYLNNMGNVIQLGRDYLHHYEHRYKDVL